MVTGDFVHVVKPLVYVVLLKRYGLSSWKPWLTMLALDAASGGCRLEGEGWRFGVPGARGLGVTDQVALQ
jgi:hypothetical protein